MADKPTDGPEWLPEEVQEVAERWGLSTGDELGPVLAAVAHRVRQWLDSDRRSFFQALYRLDVSEERVQAVLSKERDPDLQSAKIAELIVGRELQKARTRLGSR